MRQIISKTVVLLVILITFSCSTKQELGNGYFLENNKIIYRYKSVTVSWPKVPWDNKYMDVKDADVSSFTPLEPYGYAKDKNNFYYKGVKIENIDYATFEVIGDSFKGIVKDKNNVYDFNNPNIKIENVDALTYEKVIFPNSKDIWFKDKNHYFFRNKPINVDVKTFVALNERFYADKNRIYFFDSDYKIQSFEDPDLLSQNIKDTAQIIQTTKYIYSLSKKLKLKRIPITIDSNIKYFPSKYVFIIVDNKVYFDGDLMTGVDFDSFEFFNYAGSNSPTNFSKDKNHVYYCNEILDGVNPKTAKLINNKYIQDGDYKWVPDLYSQHYLIEKIKIDE